MQHPDIGLGFLMIAAIVNTSGIFVYCYFGRIASDSYMEMSNCLYDSNWQKLSISSQKYILLMIQNTQLPLYYHGFNVFILSLETFAKVSYFLNFLAIIESFDFDSNENCAIFLQISNGKIYRNLFNRKLFDFSVAENRRDLLYDAENHRQLKELIKLADAIFYIFFLFKLAVFKLIFNFYRQICQFFHIN